MNKKNLKSKIKTIVKRIFQGDPKYSKYILENEISTAMVLKEDHHEVVITEDNHEISDNKVYYISDLHLIHSLKRQKVRTKDIICFTKRFINSMLEDFYPAFSDKCITLLIGGDVSSELSIFELFVKLLRQTLDDYPYNVNVIFVLGNHELWHHTKGNLTNIIQQYRNILEKQKMYLLQDEILYIEDDDKISYISKEEILKSDNTFIRDKVRKARLILFGGIGFAGCNEIINADNGIYKKVISRTEERELSSDFRNLYDHVVNALGDKKVIVFTHMGITEWAKDYELHDNYVYVSGHSHRNQFSDDGSKRLYADNQVGYYNDMPHLKYFLIDGTYDLFKDYDDGIYEISRNEYIEFYRGKNLPITYTRKFTKLYMLKKSGYYCFIHENKSGKLLMLNGGALRELSHKNIDYYYQNMDAEIEYIKTPFMEYQKLQKQISEEIKKIGGTGHIHGAIIDIDGNDNAFGWESIAYNHLYINPIDLKITPYFAENIVQKYVYPSIAALLFDKCPNLYSKYTELITEKSNTSMILKPVTNEELMIKPVSYTNTDIYNGSRILCKMQKLNSNILATWHDHSSDLKSIPDKNNQNKDISSLIGIDNMMSCGMNATIIDFKYIKDISVKFDDGTIVEHVSIHAFGNHSIWNPNIPKPPKKPKNR